jgi:G3E family GTPase
MTRERLLPVVVVGGCHEEGRRRAVRELAAECQGTVILHHDLTNADKGVVHRVIRDMSGVWDEADVPLTNDCPCCAARVDLLPRLLRIAQAGRHRLAVVELWGGSELRPIVETVAYGAVEDQSMDQFVEVVGVVAAVDPGRLIPELSVRDTLREHGLHTSSDDERGRAEALAEQIEYADVLALAHDPRADDSSGLRAGFAMLRQLHPTARRVPLGVGELVRAALSGFDVAAARDRVNPALALLPQTAEESGIATVVWESRRPLHPARLHAALELLVPAAHRSRGRFWLANRPDLMLGWEATGATLSIEDCGPWLATLPDAVWDQYPPARQAAAALDWDARYGDRVQRLSFTAQGLHAEAITGLLDSCLLTEDEENAGEAGWRLLPDAFGSLLDPVT